MDKLWSDLQAIAEPTLQDLSPMHTFVGLLTAAQNAIVDEKTKACLADVAVARKAKKEKEKEEEKEKQKDQENGTAAAKRAKVEEQACMALFGGSFA